MPNFLPATRLRLCPPRLVPYAAPVRTFQSVHGGHLHLVDTTIPATTFDSLDYCQTLYIVPNQIRHELTSPDQQSNYWISASYARVSAVAGDGDVIKVTTAAAHGLVAGDFVEIVGVVGTVDVPKANGLWQVGTPDATSFKLVGEGNAFTTGTYNFGGYVEKHADAVARRQAVVDGGPSNAAAAPFRLPAGSHGTFRGMGQAHDHYLRYARDVMGLELGRYVSGGAVTTPYEEFNRGRVSSYPMGPAPRTSKYANGWEILSSGDNGAGKLRLTLNKNPPASWASGSPSVILMGHSNATYGSDIAAEPVFGGGVGNAQIIPVLSAAGATLTLDTPYRLAPGTGGSLIVRASIESTTNSGGKVLLESTVDHGLVAGDFVYLDSGHTEATLLRDTVQKVTAVPTAKTALLDGAWVANGGQAGFWYGANTRMLSGFAARFDVPDARRDDVLQIFLSDWMRHVGRAFARHGAQHLWADENAANYKISAVDTVGTASSDGSTERMLRRLGRMRAYARRFGRRISANITWNPTKDGMSPAERRLLQQSVDGLVSEGACLGFQRSYYQMIGPDGFVENLEWLLARGFLYYYIPQPMAGPPTAFAVSSASSDLAASPRLQFSCADPGIYPTNHQTDQANLGNPHNLSGGLFGVYGHSEVGRNGVHRQIASASPSGVYRSTTETPWDGGAAGSGGNIVSDHFGRVMKTIGLSAGAGGKVRVTTDLPHLVFPNGASPLPGPTEVYLFGYTSNGLVDGGRYAVSYASVTAFDLDGTSFAGNDASAGIAFDVHSDARYFAGLAMMLWRPGRLIVIAEASLNYVRDWKNWIQGTKPDGPYSVTNFDGMTTTAGSTSMLTNGNVTFTDCCLGEAVLITSGTLSGQFRRINGISGDRHTLTVAPAFASAVGSNVSYVVGATSTSYPTKVLEIKRSFNGGAKSISVWPQRVAVVALGF